MENFAKDYVTKKFAFGVETMTNNLFHCCVGLLNMWTSEAVSCLLQGLQSRRSLWDSKSKEYSNADKKKREYEDLLLLLHEVAPDITLAQMKAKIQSIRTQYREELRKIKKSKATGSGTSDVYKPKWQFYDECEFLQGVVGLSSQYKTNVIEVDPDEDDDPTETEDTDLKGTDDKPPTVNISKQKVTREYSAAGGKSSRKSWMEKAASAIENISKQDEPDEWDVFGKDVANDIRALPSHKRRRAKFAIQKLLFEMHDEQNSGVEERATGQWYGVQSTTAAERPNSAPSQIHINDTSASFFHPFVQSDQVVQRSAVNMVEHSYEHSQ